MTLHLILAIFPPFHFISFIVQIKVSWKVSIYACFTGNLPSYQRYVQCAICFINIDNITKSADIESTLCLYRIIFASDLLLVYHVYILHILKNTIFADIEIKSCLHRTLYINIVTLCLPRSPYDLFVYEKREKNMEIMHIMESQYCINIV